MKNLVLVLIILGFLASCKQEVSFEAQKINFDRDVCAVCKMGLTDQRYNAQAINEYGEVRWYDDIGCLAEDMRDKEQWERWKGNKVKYWIGDASKKNEVSNWIDVDKAFFDYGSHTPMGYGYSAFAAKPKSDAVYTFNQTLQRINEGKTMRQNFLEEKMLMMKDNPEKIKKLKKKLEIEKSKH